MVRIMYLLCGIYNTAQKTKVYSCCNHYHGLDTILVLFQVPLHTKGGNQRPSYYSSTTCGLNVAGPSMSFPPGPKSTLPKISPISQSLSHISAPLHNPQPQSHLDSLSQVNAMQDFLVHYPGVFSGGKLIVNCFHK